jgi:hypothetical protein
MYRVNREHADSVHVWIGVVKNGLGKRRTSTEERGGARWRYRWCDAGTISYSQWRVLFSRHIATTTTMKKRALQLPFIYPKL